MTDLGVIDDRMVPCPDHRPAGSGFMFVKRVDQDCTVEATPPCRLCRDAGFITEEQAENLRIMKEWHARRIEREESLLDAATRMNVTVSQLSSAESTGRAPAGLIGRIRRDLTRIAPRD